jgi:ABC-type antimicrobial peptide transport system permease subunit
MIELKKIPGIINASSMDGDLTGMHGGGGGIEWEGKDPNAGIEFAGFYVDYEMIEMLDVPMASGRTFSNEFGSENDKVILNETAVSMMGLKEPVGKTIKMWGHERQIIGIIKDFHYESLYNNVGPMFFGFSGPNRNTFIKIRSGMETEALAGIKKLYQSFSEGLPFEYRFLDDDYQALYAAEVRVEILSRYFAGLAILISCLGLFGLAAFTAERRLKEIGIRKVMGSSEAGIVRILSGDFIKLVFLAIMIAIPLSYILLKQWLEGFAYRIRLEPSYFIAAGLIAILIAMLTVGVQAIKASRINPAQCLKDE